VARDVRVVKTASAAADLGPYRHFMQKEIFEQPRAVADTLESVEALSPELFGDADGTTLGGVDSVLVLACGTSYYAG
jgi:glucosamine--fructose-6-phosphate aminotransferase (isomerizing)